MFTLGMHHGVYRRTPGQQITVGEPVIDVLETVTDHKGNVVAEIVSVTVSYGFKEED